jgi:acyl-CoA synthetase (AMP-forming)/AMP-acid ligase II
MNSWFAAPFPETVADDRHPEHRWRRPCAGASSSGSQGVPKQVVLTYRNLSVNLDKIAANHLLRTQDVTLGLTPSDTSTACRWPWTPRYAPGDGGHRGYAVLPQNLLEATQARRITIAHLAPSALSDLAAHGPVRGWDTSRVGHIEPATSLLRRRLCPRDRRRGLCRAAGSRCGPGLWHDGDRLHIHPSR